jgi:hypothetical protein
MFEIRTDMRYGMGQIPGLFIGVVIISLTGLSAACGHTNKKIVVVKKERVAPVVEESPAIVADPETTVEAGCNKAEQEQCNAIDDNCDGVIDEGCGYRSGAIQISLGWDSGADIDLYVTDPAGETICFKKDQRDSASGGHMDLDSRGDCREQQKINRIENIYWDGPRPPRGEYKVDLDYFSPCGKNGETHATVSISIEGRILGVYKRTIHPEERVRVLTFTLN